MLLEVEPWLDGKMVCSASAMLGLERQIPAGSSTAAGPVVRCLKDLKPTHCQSKLMMHVQKICSNCILVGAWLACQSQPVWRLKP